MNTVTNILAQLSESELLDHFETLVARDRCTTTQLLVAISEVDERKLWARHACPSMFAFCVERFHMSEQVTAKRIWAARTARRFPIILEMVERGELHLSAICLLAGHLTATNCRDILQRAVNKSSREIEMLVAALAPRPDVATRVRALPRRAYPAQAEAAVSGDATTSKVIESADRAAAAAASAAATTRSEPAAPPAATAGMRPCLVEPRASSPVAGPTTRPITPLSPRRYKIEITVDEETHDRLRSLQDLLGRSSVGRDPAAIISRAIDTLLVETLKRKAATTDRPHPACDAPATTGRPRPASPAGHSSPETPQPRSRNIPAALRRTVWRRDCGRCRYVDGQGRRCNATGNIEFHHKSPFARGGCHDADNIELRCAGHNQYQADLDFGRDFMDARRSAGAHS